MKKAIISGERRAEVVEVPDPKPIQDWALVKVRAVPMCTEYKSFVAGWKSDTLGHEAAGEVVAVAQPCEVQPGDRVLVLPQYPCGVCDLCRAGDYIYCQRCPDFAEFTGSPEGNATYAQYLLKPSWLLPKIPEGMSFEAASLACCALGPTYGPMDTMSVNAFDTVLISGAGPVGLGGVVNAKFRGARVIVTEYHPYRVEYAKRLGADAVVDPRADDAVKQLLELTGGVGVDKAVECSGSVPAQRLCLDAARRRGSICFVGENYDSPISLQVSPDLLRKGLNLHGSWMYNRSLVPEIFQVIARSPAAKQLVSHRFPMSQVQQALELSATHDCAKIILDPWA